MNRSVDRSASGEFCGAAAPIWPHPLLCDAGRFLFSSSRQQKTSANDADHLRKYLARFGLHWKSVRDVAMVT